MSAERASTGAARRLLPDGARWHFRHGPIDLVIRAEGEARDCAAAVEQAWRRFQTILPELVAELPALRRPVSERACPLAGAVARRMWAACRPFAPEFLTPMAAVAGAVADETLAALVAGRAIDKAYVNNGGDIAVHLSPGARLDAGIVADPRTAGLLGTATLDAASPVRGLATSGWRGRSFSLGIADAVTVLARSAADADAAATLIANAVDADHPAIRREPASAHDPDSDLGDRLVTIDVGALPDAVAERALAAGAAAAERYRRRGLIEGALLALGRQNKVVATPIPHVFRQPALEAVST
jgi:hypothetical protein